ncbi:MAG: polysaccharide deacetylase family protein [Candidatus Heimdallarchaeota archaeon]|nr:MAG: polysaccharide deacetylase family protein [Candidatus Heimdallarchaeota archaeon]
MTRSEISVCLTFDFDADSAQIRQLEEPGRISKGLFAVRRGLPRILSLLNKHDIKATFFVCGWVAEKYPELTKEIVEKQHEIAAHGYLHEYFDTLSIYDEKTIIDNTTKILKEFTDKIYGFRAPYFKLSSNTLQLHAEAGYIYDSSLMADDHPYLLSFPELKYKMIEFPVEWFLDDWVIFETHQHSPEVAFNIWKKQFDAILEMEDIAPGYRIMNYTFHPACIGHAYRINVLDRLISYMKTKNTKFVRMMDVAKELLTNK